MPQTTIKLGTRERLQPAIAKATPLGALGTEALVHAGQLTLSGPAPALRALADACNDAALLAERYAADPARYDQWERAERERAAGAEAGP
jgi:hypothetical protein